MARETPLIQDVAEYCLQKGFRFTEPRQFVLDIIARSKKPIGAYEVLEKLSKKLKNPKPPTAYRAIEFLSAHGFIHRIESLNAYIICQSDHLHKGSQFMICDQCGTVLETHLCDLPEPLVKKTRDAHFYLTRWNVELHGICQTCYKPV